jgi:hypothetical protein
MECARVPEPAHEVPGGGGPEAAATLLQSLNGSLHELSQPMTVLLCTLEYGASLDSLKEMKETMAISQEACERLRQTIVAMQSRVREAMEGGRDEMGGAGGEVEERGQRDA